MRTNKNVYRILLIVFVFVSLLTFALPRKLALAINGNGSTCPVPAKIRATAIFPSQLYLVDDEAFVGTNIEVAVFDNNLEFVGDRIFQSAKMLTDVYIPPKTGHIGQDPFPEGIVIHGIKNSYTQEWAKKNNLNFKVEKPWYAVEAPGGFDIQHLISLAWVLIPDEKKRNAVLRRCKSAFLNSMRPQDRPELPPIDYRFP